MRTIKLLFIDSDTWLYCLGELKNRHPSEDKYGPKRLLADEDLILSDNVRMEVIKHKFRGGKTEYDANPTLCRKIQKLTSQGEVDIVVIGNNRGAGLERAEAVAPSLRDQTIITAHQYQLGGELEELYAPKGFKHFCKRNNLRNKVKEVLGI